MASSQRACGVHWNGKAILAGGGIVTINGKIWSPASVSNGVLYIGDMNGMFYAFGT